MTQKGSRRIRYFVFIVVLLAGGMNRTSAYTIMGDVKSYEKDGYNITFSCEAGKVRLSFLRDDLVRVHMAPAGREFPKDTLHPTENGPYAVVTYDWAGVSYLISEGFDADLEGVVYNIRAGRLHVKVRKQPFKLAFCDAEGNLLVMEKEGIVNAGLGYSDSKVYETMALADDEHFFGFGAHNHPLDMRGDKIVCSTSELQSKARTGGFPASFFMSTRGYGIFFNNLDDDVTFEMGTAPEEYSFEGTSGGLEGWDMDYYLIYGPKFEDILKRYTDIVGKPMLPEKYFFGHIFMECCQWNADDVVHIAQRFRDEDWPCDVLIIDCQAYQDAKEQPPKPGDGDNNEARNPADRKEPQFQNYEWGTAFGDTAAMFETIKSLGFKTILSSGIQGPLYDWPNYDPTVPWKTRKFADTFWPRNVDGLDSWRQDNSERYPAHTKVEKFANGYESHNLFGSLWAKNVVEKMEEMGLYGRPVISRGGPVGGHRYIIPWPGDLKHGLELLKVDLNWLRNGSLSAYPFITMNLGGWGSGHGLEEQNLIRRTINIIPLIPISQLVGWGKTGENAILPWLMTPKQQELLRYYLKLRYRLHPYVYSSAIEAHQTGRPILASLVFAYQDDPNTYSKDYHFMLGRQILVVPVLKITEKWNAYLPTGRWIHYWTGKQYDGGQTVTVDAPLYGRDGLPMFVKAGAIIPMMPQMNYIYEKTPDPITLDVYPNGAGPSSYVMYDCENVKGPVKETNFKCSEDTGKIEVSISASNVAYELWVHCDQRPASVAVDSKLLPELTDKGDYDAEKAGWYYGAGCFSGSDSVKTINIKISKAAQSRLIRIEK
ncbi:MAG TPA: TIM-barrel domain-containing protein [Sedimentisphaerales bacterium]|nr:TIM-barrel domain-containing protein [Sedimentisphaerales bacterium]